MYDCFTIVDGAVGDVENKAGDDRKVTKDEWVAGYKKLGDHGFVGLAEAAKGDDAGAAAIFTEMNSGRDADGNEYGNDKVVMLAEFCAWVEKKEVEAGTPWGKLLGL